MADWTPENHERWKAAAHEEVGTLFTVLKRKSLRWSEMDAKYASGSERTNWQVLDDAIVGRLRNLRSKHGCPESLLYLGWAMEQFRKARESQGQLVGGKIEMDVQTVYDRIMEDLLLKSMFMAAKGEQERVYIHCTMEMPWVLELEGKLGLAHDAPFRHKVEVFYHELKKRSLMG